MTRPAAWTPAGSTTVAAVIGSPVAHSLSPVLFNAAFRAVGLDWVYVAFDVSAGTAGAAIEAMRGLRLGGLSVTMPHKHAVAGAVDELDDDAARLGAVNCVVPLPNGRLIGRNTDGSGFVQALRVEAGIEPAGLRCTVFGAGGAARAVALALARAGAAEVVVVNRTAAKAAQVVELVETLAPGIARVGSATDPTDTAGTDLVVNATPVGMAGTAAADESPLDVAVLRAGQIVADLVYHPTRTVLLEAALARGATPVDGLGMLLHQAAIAFTHWTAQDAPIDVMRAAVRSRFAEG